MNDDREFTQQDIDKAWEWLPAYILFGIVTMPLRWLLGRMRRLEAPK
jgi:hypothetical protein